MERERFERVWQRVQGAGSAAERQLRGEAESVAFYGWLYERCPSCRREAAALQREARRSLQALRREYFLKHGENWEEPEPRLPEGSVLGALRRQYGRELEGAALAQGSLRMSRQRRAALLRTLLLRIIQ